MPHPGRTGGGAGWRLTRKAYRELFGNHGVLGSTPFPRNEVTGCFFVSGGNHSSTIFNIVLMCHHCKMLQKYCHVSLSRKWTRPTSQNFTGCHCELWQCRAFWTVPGPRLWCSSTSRQSCPCTNWRYLGQMACALTKCIVSTSTILKRLYNTIYICNMIWYNRI